MGEQLYQLKITATGEVRDKDGNLISSGPVEAIRTVTETEAAEILASGGDSPPRMESS